MPSQLARACIGTCPHDGRTCPEHSPKAKQRLYDTRKGSAHSRGYGAQWRRYTQWYRDEQARIAVPRAGLCGSRLPGAPPTQDSECAQLGRVVLGRVVDHIRPVSGPHDPGFYDPNNHQLLCDGITGYGCHDRKRQREVRR